MGGWNHFLSWYFLFEVIDFKNVCYTTDNISRCENGHLKLKVRWLSAAATLGFKSLVR
jgi:hypothetical protein